MMASLRHDVPKRKIDRRTSNNYPISTALETLEIL